MPILPSRAAVGAELPGQASTWVLDFHAPRDPRRADASAFAGDGHQEVMPEVIAAGARKTVGDDAAFQVFGKRLAYEGLGAGVVALAVKLARAGQFKDQPAGQPVSGDAARRGDRARPV